MSGANTVDASGVYGTLGSGSTANMPGARYGAISCADSAGNFWLFGVYDYFSTPVGDFNDLWRY